MSDYFLSSISKGSWHCLGLFGNVNVWLHGGIVRVAGPFHHHLRWDTAGERKADESASAGVSAQHFIFGIGFLDTFATAEAYSFDGILKSAQLSQVFQVFVHLLVADNRQSKIVRKMLIGVFVENPL